VLTASTSEGTGTLRLEGRVGSQPWSASLDLASAVEGNGVSKLWARSKIARRSKTRRYHGANQGDVDAKVLKIALDYHLLSRLTSLVAGRRHTEPPDGETLTSQAMPTNLPAGWDFTKVFGE